MMRDVLIALCGLTPQVVTETLWALRQQIPPVVPAEIWIVTTRSGREACDRLLFGKNGKLKSFLKEYPSSRSIRYGRGTIITLKGSNGRPIEDLRTQIDNLAVADHLAEIIRSHTQRPETRLHCSIAGGRKTMGVLLAALLQIYGRPDDRLYHVLVSPEFESQEEFFYIPRRPRVLADQQGRLLDTCNARIELAEIPYVRLRAYLPEDLLKQSLPFTELVASAQKHLRALERPEIVTVDAGSRRLLIGKAEVALSPAQIRLYTAFARIKTEFCVEPERKTCAECAACYSVISKSNWDSTRAQLETLAGEAFLSAGIGYVRTLFSKTNSALAKALGSERIAKRYEISSVRRSGETRYGLAVDKTLLLIES